VLIELITMSKIKRMDVRFGEISNMMDKQDAMIASLQERRSQRVSNARRQEKLRFQAMNVDVKIFCMRFIKVSRDEQLTMLIKRINYLPNGKL